MRLIIVTTPETALHRSTMPYDEPVRSLQRPAQAKLEPTRYKNCVSGVGVGLPVCDPPLQTRVQGSTPGAWLVVGTRFEAV